MPAYAFIFAAMLKSFYVCEASIEDFGTGVQRPVYGQKCRELDYIMDNFDLCTSQGLCLAVLQVVTAPVCMHVCA